MNAMRRMYRRVEEAARQARRLLNSVPCLTSGCEGRVKMIKGTRVSVYCNTCLDAMDLPAEEPPL